MPKIVLRCAPSIKPILMLLKKTWQVFLCSGRLCRRSFLWLNIAVLSFLIGGCFTSSNKTLFATSGPGWQLTQGQAIWKPAGNHPELAVEFVLAKDSNGRNNLELTKTYLPVLLAQSTTNQWLIRFPSQKMAFDGHGRPPQRFLWLYLPDALAGNTLPAKIIFIHQTDGGWRLANRQNGEWIQGYLSP